LGAALLPFGPTSVQAALVSTPDAEARVPGRTPDFEARARAVLPDFVGAYYAASAGAGESEREGRADWDALRFRPRALRPVTTPDLRTTVLGTPVTTPVLVAPMAQQIAAHGEAEVAVARAAAAAGSLLGVSTMTAAPFAGIAATGAPWWFQVYILRARDLTELLIRRAVEHGARALVLTVDLVDRFPVGVSPQSWPEVPGRSRLNNLTPAEIAGVGRSALEPDPSVGFADIGWLAELSGLPVLVKGVVRGDDASRCIAEGAAGVIVSTHGGRRLGPSISAARALPEVVDAVGNRGEVYADSGIRTAPHVAGALAMGARGVFVGRPFLWALAAAGEAGVAEILAGLSADLAEFMVQLGVGTVAELTSDLLAPPARLLV
jgi:4-hydroxymandelate oxidase